MGIAGAGAHEQAQRARRRVAHLRRELSAAELREQLAAAERREHAWTAGAEGERLVGATLDELDGWVVLHDVRWPGRPRANLDHVAIGPGGVVVVDAKNWSGEVSVRDGALHCGSWRKDREVEGVVGATAAVTALLPPVHRSATRGVLCLAGHDLDPTGTTAGVTVVGRAQLVEHLQDLDDRLNPAAVRALARLLRVELESAAELPGEAPVRPRYPARNPVRDGRRPVPRTGRAVATRRRRRPSFRGPLLRLLLALLILWAAVHAGPVVLQHVAGTVGDALPGRAG